MATKITLRRGEFQMGHIKRTVLHYFESRALGLIICKQYKLKPYVFFLLFVFFLVNPIIPARYLWVSPTFWWS